MSILIRISLFSAGLAYIFYELDFRKLGTIFFQYNFIALNTTLLFSFFVYFILGYRLSKISHNKICTATGTIAIVIGHGFNNMLPTKLGELAKVYYISLNSCIPKTESLSVIFWERFLDLNMALFITFVLVYKAEIYLVTIPLGIGVCSVWLVLLAANHWKHLSYKIVSIISYERIRGFVHEVHEHIDKRFTLKFLSINLSLTIIIWFLFCFLNILIINWVADLGLTAEHAIIIYMVSVLGTAIPLTPGSLGIYEAAVVMAMGWYGIPKEEAVPAAILMHMIEYIPTSVATCLVIIRSKIRFSDFYTSN